MADRQLPAWVKKPPERKCRTCVYWDKPAATAALKGKHYDCTAPLPSVVNLPFSVTCSYDYGLAIKQRSKVSRDEGARCPAWADTIPPAPKAQP